MKKNLIQFFISLFLIGNGAFSAFSQANPGVNGATVTPSPQIFPASNQANTGVAGFSFNFTNNGNKATSNSAVQLTISMTGMDINPDFNLNTDILAGPGAPPMSWSYYKTTSTGGTFTGILNGNWPSYTGGIFTFKNLMVTVASPLPNLNNGVSVNVNAPIPVNSSFGDDVSTSFTYTLKYPLPVTLSSFTAKENNGDALLDWITSSEQNNAGYGVEHSLDGTNWNQLAFVNSKALNGNSNNKLNYQYIDRDLTTGTHYYRLKQTDLDGTFGYSNVAKVDNSSLNTALKVYPNPTSSYIYVEYSGAVKTPIRILDANGRVVKTLLTTSAKTKVETNEFATGTYIISIDGKTSKFTVIR